MGSRAPVDRALETGDVEQVVDEAPEAVALAHHVERQRLAFGLVVVTVDEPLGRGPDGGGGVAELMGCVREELTHGGLGSLGPMHRPVERVDHGVETGGEAAEIGVDATRLESQAALTRGDPPGSRGHLVERRQGPAGDQPERERHGGDQHPGDDEFDEHEPGDDPMVVERIAA
jgi:hypothetical protein